MLSNIPFMYEYMLGELFVYLPCAGTDDEYRRFRAREIHTQSRPCIVIRKKLDNMRMVALTCEVARP